jgi:hypothetical protein
MLRISIAIAAVGSLRAGVAPAEAAKCTSISAQCAVEIGGRCDPATGRWRYGRPGVGGTNRSGAFDACISRKLGQRK